MVTATAARVEAEEALLDAAERLLVSVGYASITTRSVAKEAGVNHGLVHYYFGSMENLLLRVLERFTDTLVERQREVLDKDEDVLGLAHAARPYQHNPTYRASLDITPFPAPSTSMMT